MVRDYSELTNRSRYAGRLTAVRIPHSFASIYFIQGPETIVTMWKHELLETPIYVYYITLKHAFGIEDRCFHFYKQDNSGPYRTPHPKS